MQVSPVSRSSNLKRKYSDEDCPVKTIKSHKYFNFPELEVIHQHDLTETFALNHPTDYIAVIDGSKIVGYYQWGTYINFSPYY